MKLKNLMWVALPAALMSSCTHKSNQAADDAPKRTVFFDKSGMDTTVKPGDNFFEYVSGNWMKKTQIPASETGWGSFYTLEDENQANLHKILDQVSGQDNAAGSNEQKVGDLYKSGMDTAAMDKLGYEPVKPVLQKIATVKNYKDLVSLAAD